MTAADADTFGKLLQIYVIRESLRYQSESSRDNGRSAFPCRRARRRFGTAAAAWAKSGLLSSCSASEETDVAALGRAGRAYRPAIYAGGADGREEAPVESWIACT